MDNRFSYTDLKGLININTLSPSHHVYYKVQKPISINMSNFACTISFWTVSNEFLYYRDGYLAHWLEPFGNIELVKWSLQGNLAYFFEYKRNECYESVFLDFKNSCSYRIDETQYNSQIVEPMGLVDRKYDEEAVMGDLLRRNIAPRSFFKDEIRRRRFVCARKWYP